ncbi:hypothetical protein DH2020_047670 [Rehmannia glutinosa]|uniref:Uncharacterized protein n=1 Tax=Rehmannia glutinosa TaxID=99300 RepID=A0ABR0U7U3_REHGL
MATATTTTTKRRQKRQPQQLRPKNSIRKPKTQGKKKKSSNNKLKSNEKRSENETAAATAVGKRENDVVQWATASQQLSFFVNQYQSANYVQLSSLELDSLKETCMVELCQGPAQDITGKLDEHVKVSFGSSWKEVLCEKHLHEGQVDPGNPALLVISSSALRSLELFRELRSLTKECHAAKLFSKHMKIEEQEYVDLSPARIKKLIDMEALGLSRLALIVLDMHQDVKGYSLFTLPQVRFLCEIIRQDPGLAQLNDKLLQLMKIAFESLHLLCMHVFDRDEFWDLYKSYFHQPLLEGSLRLCLYGPVPTNCDAKEKASELMTK